MVFLACCVVVVRLQRVVDGALDHAALAIKAAEEKALEVASTSDTIAAVVSKLDEREAYPIADDPSRLVAACNRLNTTLEKLDNLTALIRAKLETVAGFAETAGALGLRVDVSRVDEAIDTLDALAERMDRVEDSLRSVVERLPQGSLKDAAGRAALNNILEAANGLLSPLAAFTEQVERLSDALGNAIERRRADARFLASSAVAVAIVLAAWMGLGQVALIRGGLAREPSTAQPLTH